MGKKRCLGCMESYDDGFQVCPHCGYVEGTPAKEAYHLEPGTVLNKKYTVGRVLGYGGFGVTYIGYDNLMNRRVAIKEYLPTEFSTRSSGTIAITIFSGEKEEQFLSGIAKFSDEAKRLANLEQVPGVVRIYDTFTENNTAYIVMEYLDGETLKERLKREEKIPVEEAVKIILPILGALKEVHASGLLHRDVSPDNIFLTRDGDVKLLDFGAARFATTSHSRSLSVIVKEGYAPEEQYRSKGEQGTWTDVYACGATLYKMITGVTPEGAMERREKDELQRPSKLGIKIDRSTETAIMNAMNIRIQDRTQTAADFERELTSETTVKTRKSHLKTEDSGKWPRWVKMAIAGAGLIVATVLVLLLTGIIEIGGDTGGGDKLAEDEVRMPGVMNISQAEALSILTASELNPKTENALYNDSIKEGYIIWQQYAQGEILKKQSTVEIRASIGTHVEPLVDLSGKTQQEAEELLKAAGFENVKIEEVVSSTKKGLVDRMSPEPGAEYAVDTEIILYVSRGMDYDPTKETTIPNVIGKTQEEAKTLAEQHRVAIEVKEAAKYDSSKPEGVVVDQSPAGDTQGHEGDTLIIYINKKNLVKVPSIKKGESKSVVESRLKSVGLVPKFVYQKSEEARDTVLSVSVASGTEVEKGTTITIYISDKEEEKVSVPSLVGLTKAAAQEALNNAGLNYSSVEEESTKTEGTVTNQNPSAGTQVAKGTKVTIYIAKKKEEPTSTEEPTSETENVKVPNVIGMSKSSALSALSSAGLNGDVQTEVSTEPEGTVIGQDVSPNTMLEKGTTVTITVATKISGPYVKVPNLIGKTKSAAESALTDVGLKLGNVSEKVSTSTAGTVIEQGKAAGTEVDEGSTVNITIAKEDTKVEVPNLIGKTKAQAESALTSVGLKLGTVDSEDSTATAGTVIRQKTAEGTKVEKGSSVSITIAKAPQVIVPDLSSYSQTQIKSVLQDAGLTLGSMTKTHDKSHSDGDVISQNPKAGSSVDKGSTVNVTICDNTTVTVYRYKEVIDWEYTTTNVNSAPGSDWVKEKNPTTEGDVTTYYWKKPVWSGWSEWSTDKVKPSSERQVETDEQYLY